MRAITTVDLRHHWPTHPSNEKNTHICGK